jgi:hypothetical protein
MALVNHTLEFDTLFKDLSYGYNGEAFSIVEFKDEFLWGIPICNQVTGQSLPDYVLRQKLLSAQKYVEGMLDLKIFKQYILETKEFVREEYMEWGYTKASWFINKPFVISGVLNEQKVLVFPASWVTTRRKITKDDSFSKCMYFVPNGQGTVATFAYNLTINNLYSFYGSRIIPEYWQLEYLTGFEIIPYDIINLIGMQAAIEILLLIEMTVVSGGGFTFGSASNSLGLDGMSQSVSKANGGNIFRQRIQQYEKQIATQLTQLKHIYSGFTFDVV